MFKFLSALVLSTLVVATPVSAQTNNTVTQIQSPCREAGHTREQACVVVNRFLSGRDNNLNEKMMFPDLKPVQAKYQNFSVIYVYRVHPAARTEVSIDLKRGQSGIISDLNVGQPTQFWVTTNNGGRTWSEIKTVNMASVISY